MHEAGYYSWPFFSLYYIMISGGRNMEFILIILSSILFTAPYYYPALFFLSWFAFIPLIYLVNDYDYSHSFIIALLIGFLNSVFSLHWLYQPLNTALKMPFSFNLVILFIYFLFSALPLAGWVIINKFLQPQNSYSPFIAALSWTVLEYFRFEFFNFNPFNYFAYTQSAFPLVVQYAGYGGVFLVSFITVLFASYLVKIYLEPAWKKIVPLILIFIVVAAVPFFTKTDLEANISRQKVDLLVADSVRDDSFFDKIAKEIDNLTDLVKKSKNEVIFMPEKSISFDLIRNNYYRDQLFSRLKESLGTSYLQLGAAAAKDQNYQAEVFNSLFLFSGDMKMIKRTNKQGNIMSGINFPYLKEINRLMADYLNYKPDLLKQPVSAAEIDVKNIAYINLFAEEIFIPVVNKKNNQIQDMNLIVNVAAEEKAASKVYNNLSFAAAVFRAAESRTDLIRAVSGGLSGYINERGKVLAKTELANDILPINLTLRKETSYYQKYPLRIIKIIIAIFILIVIIKSIAVIKNKWSSRN